MGRRRGRGFRWDEDFQPLACSGTARPKSCDKESHGAPIGQRSYLGRGTVLRLGFLGQQNWAKTRLGLHPLGAQHTLLNCCVLQCHH